MSRNVDEVDALWTVCAVIGIGIVGITIFFFGRILQNLHCIYIPAASDQINLKTYCTVAATGAAINVFICFSEHFICTQWSCWESVLDISFSLLQLNSYTLAKFFLYSIFIGRLFNPYYYQIFHYHKCIQYLLWMLLIVLVIGNIMTTINLSLWFFGIQYIRPIMLIGSGVRVIADTLLSIATMILFFRPICRRRHRSQSDDPNEKSMVNKYALISALQFIASISFHIDILVGSYLNMIQFDHSVLVKYREISRIIGMLDCLLLMICIDVGFIRKQRKSCCKICRMFCIWCCCGCCRIYTFPAFAEVFEKSAFARRPHRRMYRRKPMVENLTLNDVSTHQTLIFSTTPDIPDSQPISNHK